MFLSKVRHDELRQNNNVIASHSVRKIEELLDIFMDETLILLGLVYIFFESMSLRV